MATKVTILGDESPIKKRRGRTNKIEFHKCLTTSMKISRIEGLKSKPCDWGNVKLISKNYDGCGNDLILAYEINGDVNGASDDCLFVGHFNDGAV